MLLLATSNPGKAAELRALLAASLDLSHIRLLTPRDFQYPLPDVDETGATFAENARLKACALAQAANCVTLADDSGLCVDAIGGAPGLHSARWAGPTDADRTAALLHRLADVPTPQRTARFVCAACAAAPDGTVVEAEGVCEGVITSQPRGVHGFGYDPIFLHPAFGRTMAELTPIEKNQVSHRARAIAVLALGLRDLLQNFPKKCL